MKKFTGLKVLALAVAVGVLATPAWATLTVELNSTTCAATSACNTGTANSLNWATSTAVGNMTISVTASDSAGVGSLNWTIDGTPTATGTFTFDISDNGFTSPTPPVELTANVGGSSETSIGVAGTLSAQGFFSSTNGVFATGSDSTSTFGNSFVGVSSGSSATGGPFSGTTPYSLTEQVTVMISSLSTGDDKAFELSGNVSTIPAATVPEPASVSLLGGVLLLTAGAIRRKIRRA